MQDNAKTWGPFTGLQLTVIICVLTVVILFPVGAWAAISYSNVSITDGTYRARVDATRKLNVGDGSGNFTIDGAVAPAIPSNTFRIPYTSAPGYTQLRAPQTRAFGITSLTVFNVCGGTLYLDVYFVPSTGSSLNVTRILASTPMTHVTYPTPMVAKPPSGGTVAMYVYPAAQNCFYVSGVGLQS